MGIPENPDFCFSSSRSLSVFSGLIQIGSRMKPCLYFFKKKTEQCSHVKEPYFFSNTYFDLSDLFCLSFDGAVVMDYAYSPHKLVRCRWWCGGWEGGIKEQEREGEGESGREEEEEGGERKLAHSARTKERRNGVIGSSCTFCYRTSYTINCSPILITCDLLLELLPCWIL